MKKQRTNSPRFLGALGFLGFLGALGSQNPEITRWAYLSWLSLISLLVFIPTVDVNSRWAHYRFHPRRKGLLVFLIFLGFLGFLFSKHHQWHRLAILAMTSLFAADLKSKNPVPVRELVPIFALLFVAVILPLGGMIWFMTAAVSNEQMAVRQRLTEVYESQLNAAAGKLEADIGQRREVLGKYSDFSPARRFNALVRESIADSILILDEHGQLEYPINPERIAAPVSSDAIALREEVRHLLKAGSASNVWKKIEGMGTDETLRDARDESGRLILPALQLFYLQTAPDGGAALEVLRKTVTDYGVRMASGRRLFFLQELSRFGDDVEPWLGAETLATELEESFSDLPPDWTVKGFGYFPDEDVYLFFSEDRRTAALFRGPQLLARLQKLADASSSVEGVRILLEQEHDRKETQPWLTKPFPELGGSWFLDLYVDGDDPFSAGAKQRVAVYFWTGCAVLGIMSGVCGVLIRSLLAQQRLTRMKNDFVATVTHELKTPLASTRLFVDTLLEGRCRDKQQEREYLELIARENKRLSRLIDNFLTFSRMERNKRTFNFEDVEPASIAATATDTVRENYESSGCTLTMQVADKLPPIIADKDAMITVLLNLLDNACKYSNDNKQIELKVFEKESAICFQVQDNGIGMAKRELSKILDRFYQVDQSLSRKCGGAGLGLSIVNFIVEAHGGKIDIQSEPGEGSTFTVKIPLNGEGYGG